MIVEESNKIKDQAPAMPEGKVQQFLESGVHFGQLSSKRSPKMDPYVYGVTESGMQIIDLNSTWAKLQEAGRLIARMLGEDKNILFVGTNERAVSRVLLEYAEKHDLNHVTSRWLGGTLTNPVTRNRIQYLRELEGMEQSGLVNSMTPKEKSVLMKRLKKLRRNLGGLKNIRGSINCIVIVDPVHDINATLEALKKNKSFTVIAIADTNCTFSPDSFDVVVPCNVSSMSSLRQILDELMRYYEMGKNSKQSNIVLGAARRKPAAPLNLGAPKGLGGVVVQDFRQKDAQPVSPEPSEPAAVAVDKQEEVTKDIENKENA